MLFQEWIPGTLLYRGGYCVRATLSPSTPTPPPSVPSYLTASVAPASSISRFAAATTPSISYSIWTIAIFTIASAEPTSPGPPPPCSPPPQPPPQFPPSFLPPPWCNFEETYPDCRNTVGRNETVRVLFDTFNVTSISIKNRLNVSQTPADNAIPFSSYPRGVATLIPPFPVNAWWSTLIVDNLNRAGHFTGGNAFTCHPWQYTAQNNGFLINKPTMVNENERVTMRRNKLHVIVGTSETLNPYSILRYDELTVTLRFTQFGNEDSNMQLTIFQGSPFTTFKYTRLAPLFLFSRRISNINGECPVASEFGTFIIASDIFQLRFVDSQDIYLILFENEVNVSVRNNSMHTDTAFTGWVRVTSNFETESSTCELISNKNAIVTEGSVTFGKYNSSHWIANLHYETETTAVPIILTLTHHNEIAITSESTPWMATHLGKLKSIASSDVPIFIESVSNNHTFEQPWPQDCKYRANVFWELSNTEQSTIEAFHGRDFKELSKNLFQSARYVLIYEALNLLTKASMLRQRIAKVLSDTFESSNSSFVFVKDVRWGGVVLNTSRLSVLLERGTGYYNNIPQFFSYIMYAASVVIKKDNLWSTQVEWVGTNKYLGDTLSNLILNFNHNKLFNGAIDFYTGRSWTKGVIEGEREESHSSEIAMAYHACALWHRQIEDYIDKNRSISDVFTFALSMIIMTHKRYFQIYPGRSTVDSPFLDGNVVGTITGNSLSRQRANGYTEDIYLSQFYPFVSITNQRLTDEWVYFALQALEEKRGTSVRWQDYFISAKGILDPISAYDEALRLQQFGPGLSKVDLLWWVSSQISRLDHSVYSCETNPKVYSDTCSKGTCCELELGLISHAGQNSNSSIFTGREKIDIYISRGLNVIVLDEFNAVSTTFTFDLIQDEDINTKESVANNLFNFVQNIPMNMITIAIVEDSVGHSNAVQIVQAMSQLGSTIFNVSVPGFRIPFIGIYKNGLPIVEVLGPYEGAVSTSTALPCLDSRQEYIQVVLLLSDNSSNQTIYEDIADALSLQQTAVPPFFVKHSGSSELMITLYVNCSNFYSYFNSTLFEQQTSIATVKNITCVQVSSPLPIPPPQMPYPPSAPPPSPPIPRTPPPPPGSPGSPPSPWSPPFPLSPPLPPQSPSLCNIYEILQDVDLLGTDTYDSVVNSTVEECCNICSISIECNSFVFVDRVCYYKNGAVGKLVSSGCIAFIKHDSPSPRLPPPPLSPRNPPFIPPPPVYPPISPSPSPPPPRESPYVPPTPPLQSPPSIPPLPPTHPPPMQPPFAPPPFPPPPYGCTNSIGTNYNPHAIVDSGDCEILGCINIQSPLYNTLATVNDGSCNIFTGCMDSTAENYRSIALIDSSKCTFRGCIDPQSTNYNPSATLPDICTYSFFGCLNEGADNYNKAATRDDGTCIISGCTNASRSNYNENATVDDGLCVEPVPGCTDSTAQNYNGIYSINDGSCRKPGCTDSTYPFFDTLASFNDGCSCLNLCGTSNLVRSFGSEFGVGDTLNLKPSRIPRVLVENVPMVSVIVLTCNRNEFANFALENIAQQDYPNLEVIVVDDGTSKLNPVSSVKTVFDKHRLSIRIVSLHGQLTIGEKRNIAVAESMGEIIVHWDDDDIFTNNRVSSQVFPILLGKTDITMIYHSLFANLPSGNMYRTLQNHFPYLGSLSYRKSISKELPFKAVSLAEDLDFIMRALGDCQRLSMINDVESIYTRHLGTSRNTWIWSLAEESRFNLKNTSRPPFVTDEMWRRYVRCENSKQRTCIPKERHFPTDFENYKSFPFLPAHCCDAADSSCKLSSSHRGLSIYENVYGSGTYGYQTSTATTRSNPGCAATRFESSLQYEVLAGGYGCMDPVSDTYNAFAYFHRCDLCYYALRGCTDSNGVNYNPLYEIDDNSCSFPVRGCTIPSITLNYNALAVVLEGCVFKVYGCTNSSAFNYQFEANVDDASCKYPVWGCTDETCLNFDSLAILTRGCIYAIRGCRLNGALNVVPDATIIENSLCIFNVFGCTVQGARNFDSLGTVNDGSCEFYPPPFPPTPRPLTLVLNSSPPPPPPPPLPRLPPLPQLPPGFYRAFQLQVVFTIESNIDTFDSGLFKGKLSVLLGISPNDFTIRVAVASILVTVQFGFEEEYNLNAKKRIIAQSFSTNTLSATLAVPVSSVRTQINTSVRQKISSLPPPSLPRQEQSPPPPPPAAGVLLKSPPPPKNSPPGPRSPNVPTQPPTPKSSFTFVAVVLFVFLLSTCACSLVAMKYISIEVVESETSVQYRSTD